MDEAKQRVHLEENVLDAFKKLWYKFNLELNLWQVLRISGHWSMLAILCDALSAFSF